MSIILLTFLTLDLNSSIADEKYKQLAFRFILTSFVLNHFDWKWYVYCMCDLCVWYLQGCRLVYFVQVMIHFIQVMSYPYLKLMFVLLIFLEFIVRYKFQSIVLVIYCIIPNIYARLFQILIVHCLLIEPSMFKCTWYVGNVSFLMCCFWVEINRQCQEKF